MSRRQSSRLCGKRQRQEAQATELSSRNTFRPVAGQSAQAMDCGILPSE